MRDGAAIITLATEAKVTGIDTLPVLERVAALQASAGWLSTQEQSWLILAANAMSANAAKPVLSVDGKAQGAGGNSASIAPRRSGPAQGHGVKNNGTSPLYASATVIGVPAQDLPPRSSNGIEIQRNVFTPDGKPADLSKIKQSDVLIVQIKGTRSATPIPIKRWWSICCPRDSRSRTPGWPATRQIRPVLLAQRFEHAELCRIPRRPLCRRNQSR